MIVTIFVLTVLNCILNMIAIGFAFSAAQSSHYQAYEKDEVTR